MFNFVLLRLVFQGIHAWFFRQYLSSIYLLKISVSSIWISVVVIVCSEFSAGGIFKISLQYNLDIHINKENRSPVYRHKCFGDFK